MSYGAELVRYWCKKLQTIVGSKIYKIEGGNAWVTLSFSDKRTLLLSWDSQSCGIALINENDKKQLLNSASQTPPIVNVLKRQLLNSLLIGVKPINRDRIIRFEFSKIIGAGFSAKRYIVIELMERYSNLLLLDESEKIIETVKHATPADNSYRSVLPGLPYILPPTFKGISIEHYLASDNVGNAENIIGFGKKFRTVLDKLQPETRQHILSLYYTGEIDAVSMNIRKHKNYIFPFPSDTAVSGTEILSEKSLGFTVTAEPLLIRTTNLLKRQIETKLKHEIGRREKQINDIRNLLGKSDEANKAKNLAETILGNLWQIKQGSSRAEINIITENGEYVPTVIELDPSLSPSKFAEKLFKKYKKIISAQERAKEILEKAEEELISYSEDMSLASVMDNRDELTELANELGIKQKQNGKSNKINSEAVLPPHKKYEFAAATVLAGLSANGNRYATFKYAQNNDVWFHVYGFPGSHVILRYKHIPNDEEQQELEMFCASLAVHFSKADGTVTQRVDKTLKKYVKTIKSAIANVTYREFSSIFADGNLWTEIYKKSEAL